ncbi:MAG: formimidoylglutamase [Phycisphaerales bacterium]|nr:formimidoylglutamase [Phycisphaerales bacterium]
MTIPHTQPGVWPDTIPDARLAARVRRDRPAGCRVALLGLPDDTGVRLNHGRPGAAEGPAALRAALAKYGVAEPSGFTWPAVFDAGDVQPAGDDLQETHRRVSEAAAALLDLDLFPIAVGGGHDLTFPFVRAVAEPVAPVHMVYFDPHLDVRDETGSGMPFRRLVESGSVDALTIHGFQPFANAAEHVRWFQAHGGRVSDMTPDTPWPDRPTAVSLDMDVIDQAFAPGVSATNPCGWTPEGAARWVAAAGRNPQVRCFDIMELSPPNDPSGRTARLAAHLLLTFLRAFAERPA